MFKSASLLLSVFLLASSALADSFLPPCPYIVKSADSTKHFVMLTKPSEDDCGGRSPKDSAEGKALRAKYRSSGVYENGDPNKPLWTFDEDWWFARAYLANDGSHIVRISVFGGDSSAPAFTIYKDGIATRTYKVNELVRDEDAISYTTSMVQWSKNLYIDDETSTFNVETNDGISYAIDLSTGEIVRQGPEKPPAKTGENSSTEKTGDSPSSTCLGFVFLVAATFFASRKSSSRSITAR